LDEVWLDMFSAIAVRDEVPIRIADGVKDTLAIGRVLPRGGENQKEVCVIR
jgi:hypothetical protein